MKIAIPNRIIPVLDALEKNGFEAYLVGGCVRDSLLGNEPADWDIATSANPDELRRVFSSYKSFDVGIAHGTLSVISEDQPVEITSFRKDGPYSDRRRPDSVSFGKNLPVDLGRRDFTINAMAYSEKTGIVDLFGGMVDLRDGIIRCVGDPDARFCEDALRIMRALRFAAQHNFSLHPDTAKAVISHAGLLEEIAPERVAKELDKLILTSKAGVILTAYPEVLPFLSRHLAALSAQKRQRLCAELTACPPILSMRLCFLLKDCPDINTAMRRLGYSKALIAEVCALCSLLALPFPCDRVGIKRLLKTFDIKAVLGRAELENIVGEADRTAKLHELLDDILASNEPYSLVGLSIRGEELLTLGIHPGPRVGKILDQLLNMVIENPTLNVHGHLLELAQQML